MRRLSAQLVAGLAHKKPQNDDEIFELLGRVLSDMRGGRPVIFKWTAFPPETASGMWVELPDLDILAIREDVADLEHALVIWGHEAWHMIQGHCTAHTPVGPAAARSRTPEEKTVERAVDALLASPDPRLSHTCPADLRYAARTDFHAAEEQEAERFGLELATDVREYLRTLRHPDLHQVTGRIEKSLEQGPWS
jgi:hypothetical protein